jgi:hypothetical protein
MSEIPRRSKDRIDSPSKPEIEFSQERRNIEDADDFWHMVDSQFKDITRAGKSAFVVNKNINIVLVIIGVALIGNSILYTWLRDVDAWSTLMGGIGIGAFIIIFFNNSQSNINKAVASLASIFMIYKGHSREYETITDYDHEMHVVPGARSIDEIIKMNQELERSISFYVNLIHTHLEVFKADTKEPAKVVVDKEKKADPKELLR